MQPYPMSAPARATVQHSPQSANPLATHERLLTDFGHRGLSGVRPIPSPVPLEGNMDQRANPQKAVHETRSPGNGSRPYLDRP